MTDRNEANEMWRQVRHEARERARRRMRSDLLWLSRLEERGLIRVQLINPDNKHVRVHRADDPEVWCDFYPTRGTIMLRYGQGAYSARGVRGVLKALGVSDSVEAQEVAR